MNPFVYAVNSENNVIQINPCCHYYSLDKTWNPIMPYLMEFPCEMGVYCIEDNHRYNAPFVWNNVKITSLEFDKDKKGYFKIDTVIYPIGFKGEKITHTFFCKNGLYFFLDSVLKTINTIIEKGYPIDKINFDFLDAQCEGWNFRAANGQSCPHFELPYECEPIGFYRLINEMNIDVYENSSGGRNGGYIWLNVEMVLKTTNEYVNSVITKCLHTTPIVNLKNNTTKYIFDIEEHCHDDSYQNYRRQANEETKDRIKKELSEKIIVNCIKMIDSASAALYHSLKHI